MKPGQFWNEYFPNAPLHLTTQIHSLFEKKKCSLFKLYKTCRYIRNLTGYQVISSKIGHRHNRVLNFTQVDGIISG